MAGSRASHGEFGFGVVYRRLRAAFLAGAFLAFRAGFAALRFADDLARFGAAFRLAGALRRAPARRALGAATFFSNTVSPEAGSVTPRLPPKSSRQSRN